MRSSVNADFSGGRAALGLSSSWIPVQTAFIYISSSADALSIAPDISSAVFLKWENTDLIWQLEPTGPQALLHEFHSLQNGPEPHVCVSLNGSPSYSYLTI